MSDPTEHDRGSDASQLTRFGFDDRAAASLASFDIPDSRPARVVRSAGGGLCHVVDASGEALVGADGTVSRRAGLSEWPVTGDWVLLVGDAVVAVASRRSWLARSDPSDPHREQVLVANVDLVGCVQALDRELSLPRLERLAALAWDGGARPFVLLTKSDLVDDADDAADRVRDALVHLEVLVVSSETGEGLDELTELARHGTTALIGPSGAGKSTLVNALVGEHVQATGTVRAGDAKGRHTTTARELVPLPRGGVLVDMPGLRAVGVGGASEGVEATFTDIAELGTRCRFRDCSHDHEPGCAVRAAVDSGELERDRLDRYLALRAEVHSAAVRADPAASRARARRLGRIYREAQNRRRD